MGAPTALPSMGHEDQLCLPPPPNPTTPPAAFPSDTVRARARERERARGREREERKAWLRRVAAARTSDYK
jgi:hypothetical protein